MKLFELKSLIKEVMDERLPQRPTAYNTPLKSGESPMNKEIMFNLAKVREGATALVDLSFKNKISDAQLTLIINEVSEMLEQLESSRGKNRPVKLPIGTR